jgi:hypothetical protein
MQRAQVSMQQTHRLFGRAQRFTVATDPLCSAMNHLPKRHSVSDQEALELFDSCTLQYRRDLLKTFGERKEIATHREGLDYVKAQIDGFLNAKTEVVTDSIESVISAEEAAALKEAMGLPEFKMALTLVGDKTGFRATDANFPDLEGLGIDFPLAIIDLADNIEASIQSGQNPARKSAVLNYAKVVRAHATVIAEVSKKHEIKRSKEAAVGERLSDKATTCVIGPDASKAEEKKQRQHRKATRRTPRSA